MRTRKRREEIITTLQEKPFTQDFRCASGRATCSGLCDPERPGKKRKGGNQSEAVLSNLGLESAKCRICFWSERVMWCCRIRASNLSSGDSCTCVNICEWTQNLRRLFCVCEKLRDILSCVFYKSHFYKFIMIQTFIAGCFFFFSSQGPAFSLSSKCSSVNHVSLTGSCFTVEREAEQIEGDSMW